MRGGAARVFFPSPLVGEGGFAKRRRVRGSLRGYKPLIRRGLRIADAKHRRPIKERRPEAAYGHLLPQGEKGRKATSLLFRYPSAMLPRRADQILVRFGRAERRMRRQRHV